MISRRALKSSRPFFKWGLAWCGLVFAGLLCARAVAEGVATEIRGRLEDLSALEKQELDRKRERFYGLPAGEQQRLRRLHHELDSSDDGDQLRQIMKRYALWLRELSAGQRAELLSMPPEARLEQIKRLQQQQERGRMRHYAPRALSDADLAVIVGWMEDFVAEHEEEILKRLPQLGSRWQAMEPSGRRQMLVQYAARSRLTRDLLRPDAQDILRIKNRLSRAAQQELIQAQEEGQLAELAQRWMRAAMLVRRSPPEVPREELQQFYAELDAGWREYLESLPADRMESELRRWYHFRRHFSDGPPPFGRPGEGPRGRMPRGRPGIDPRSAGPPGEDDRWPGRSVGEQPAGDRPP